MDEEEVHIAVGKNLRKEKVNILWAAANFPRATIVLVHVHWSSKWYQRVKVQELLECDSNTKYFQLAANGKYRKSRIFQLRHEGQIIEDDDALKKHITRYYKNLFGPSDESTISLDESRTDKIPQVSDVENEQLLKPFSEEKVR
jgi:hypothetical protein